MYYKIVSEDEKWFVTENFRYLPVAENILIALRDGSIQIGQPADLKIIKVYEDHDYPRVAVDARKVP